VQTSGNGCDGIIIEDFVGLEFIGDFLGLEFIGDFIYLELEAPTVAALSRTC
jgi:hypothetical protein